MSTQDVICYRAGASHEAEMGDESKFQNLGTATIVEAKWIMNVNGEISFKLITEDPAWIAKVSHQADKLMFVVNTPNIMSGDVFSVYTPIDPDCFEKYEQVCNPDHEVDYKYIVLILRKRVYAHDDISHAQVLDIRHYPDKCLMCGSPVMPVRSVSNEFEGCVKYTHVCTNPQCDVYAYRDLSRYVTQALKIPGYNTYILHLIKRGVLHNALDLYEAYPRKLMYEQDPKTYVKKFLSRVDDKMGKTSLTDYLSSLPITSPKIIKQGEICKQLPYWLYKETIDKDFSKDPQEFMRFITDNFQNYCIMDNFHEWNASTRDLIEKYMSVYSFFQYSELYCSLPEFEDYISQLSQLQELGVFNKS